MADEKELQGVLSDLGTQLRAMVDYDEKHLRWSFIIKVVLLAFIAIYMGWAYSSFRPVDANFVIFMAQEKVNEALPEAKEQMAARLEKMAPAVVDQVGAEIMKNVPGLGRRMETAAQEALVGLGETYQKDLMGWFAEFIMEKRAVVDEMFPDMSSYDKITTMRRFVIEDTQAALDGMSYEIGGAVKGHPFTTQLHRLAQGKDLTPKEKLQREVLALWYVLVQKKIDDL